MTLHIAGNMGVGVQREAGFCVAQNTGEGLGVHPSGQGVCGEGVPEIVEADIGQSGFFQAAGRRRQDAWDFPV